MDYNTKRFETLFKESYPLMYRMAFTMMRNVDDTKDVVNQVFEQIWKNKPKISESCIRGYLLVATRNQCLHLLRSQQQQQQIKEEFQLHQEINEDEDQEELLLQVQQIIIENLTEQDRRVLQLHYNDNMTYEETASKLGISSSAVNKHITRSLTKIRSILKLKNAK